VIGRGPVWAAFGITFPQQLLIVNRDSDTVTFFTPSIGNASNLSLPSPQPGGDKPVFVTIVQDPATTNDIAFTANSASNTVSLIDGATKVVRTTVPVGTTPVWIAGIPSQRKMYVVNKGDGTVSVISTSDGSVVHPPIAVGSAPVAVVTNASATTAYVVNSGSGNVSVIDTASDTVTSTIATGAGSNFAIFDPKLLRVYVTNGTANSVTVIDASTGSGGVLRNVSLPAGATKPVGVAALSDGTRFYTVNQATNNVTVFDAQSFAARTTIAVGTNPVFIAASSDSTRVYVANHDATVDTNGNLVQPPGTTIIRAIASPSENPPKAADTVVTTIPATFTDPQTCQQESATCVRTQPTFVISQ
jgi:YVTN family beta-propeller protein